MALLDDIKTLETSLSSRLADTVNGVLTRRPSTFDIANATAYIPDPVKFNSPGAVPTTTPLHLAAIPDPVITLPDPIGELTVVPTPTDAPTYTQKSIAAPDAPVDKAFTAPVVEEPGLPNAPVVAMPGSVALGDLKIPDNAVGLPNAPSLTPLIAPTSGELYIPSPLSLANLPVFSGTAPDLSMIQSLPYSDNPLTHFDTSGFNKKTWESATRDMISADLTADIKTGRTGIPAALEDDLWRRQLERDTLALMDGLNSAADEFAAGTGFDLPPGRLDNKRQEMITVFGFKRTDTSREIAFEQAKMAFDNRQKAIGSMLSLEQMEMQFTMQSSAFLLSVAKETVNAALAIYNGYIAQMDIRLRAYMADASVFKTELEAFTVQIEIYKGELEASRLRGDLNVQAIQIYNSTMAGEKLQLDLYEQQSNTALTIQKSELEASKLRGDLNAQAIQIYNAKLAAQELMVKIYTEQVNAASTAATLQKLKLDGFLATIQAYDAELRTKESQYKCYEAELNGETAKIKGFEAMTQAFSARVSATGEQNRALGMQVESQGKRAEAMAETAKVQLAHFQALVAQAVETGQLSIEEYKAQIQAFLAGLKQSEEIAKVDAINQTVYEKVWDSQQEIITKRADIMVKQVEAENTNFTSNAELSARIISMILSAIGAFSVDLRQGTI
jgi:hypothetical protein